MRPRRAVPSACQAIRISSLGSFNVELYDANAPQTVANFLSYMNKGPADQGGYNFTLIHRSAKTFDPATNTDVPFIIQGGGFACCILQRPVHIGTDSPVPNEFSPSRSNVRGTIAMAKLGGLPDSATSEWFINLRDNSANLDTQNGGFTVFGHVLDTGMDVVDKIAAQPTILNQAAFDENLQPISISNVPWFEKKNDYVYVTRVCINNDSDGACQDIENMAPGEDGNGDGIPDRDQPNVTTIQTLLGATATFEAGSMFRLDPVNAVSASDAASLLTIFKSPPDQSVHFNNGIYTFSMIGGIGLADGTTTPTVKRRTIRPTIGTISCSTERPALKSRAIESCCTSLMASAAMTISGRE
jgi:cyclophilin family peptidyl-prolyl cis-trans isomerase